MEDKSSTNLYRLLKEDAKRVYVIAEAGLNHGGSKERALALVRAAKWAGADAVKFQTFRAERLASTRPATLTHTKGQPNLQELFKKLELPFDAFRALFKEAKRLNIDFLSTPFDEGSADFLDELGVTAFKIASGDITHRPLIEHVSRKQKPVLLSTGMSSGTEIEKAIDWMHTQANEQTILLHCVSSYPASDEELNLKSVEYLRTRFGVPVGFSDHSVGSLGATVAVALGAQIIERHFMIETRGDIPDLAVSMDAKQLKGHIEELRKIGTLLGTRGKCASEAESRNLTASRRSLYANRPIAPGEKIDAGMLAALRPAIGISPEHFGEVIGKHAMTAIEAGAPGAMGFIGMKKINVLITAASRRVPLVRAFRDAVGKFGKGRVITTDINPLSPALYFGHKHHIVPLTTDRYYIPIIESICDAEDVSLVIPTIDDELPIFGSARARFESVGIRVAISSEQTALICNDKYETFRYCRKNNIPVPETCLGSEYSSRKLTYPVIVKPRFGRGSVNVFTVGTAEQLRMFANYVPDSIVQDYIGGTEFTVDVLCNFSGKVISVVPRERLVIRAGVSDKGITRKIKNVMDFAADVAGRLQIVGAANIQCKWDGRRVTLIEINPRFSGGIPLTLASGADFPSWLLQMAAGMDVRSQVGKFQDGLAMMSFEESIFAKESDLMMRESEKPRMLSRMRQVSSYVN